MLEIQNTATTNTFDFWRQRTNEMASAFSNCVVTTDANASSTTATGNAGITGTFTAANGFISSNTGSYYVGNSVANGFLTPLQLKVGNTSVNISISANVVTLANNILVISSNTSTNVVANSTSIKLSNSSSNIAITVPTSEQYSDGGYYLNANGSWGYIGVGSLLSLGSNSGISSAGKLVDTFPIASYRAAEYIITVTDNAANNKVSSKLMTMHDGGAAYLTEYAQIISNNNIGYFSIDVSGSNVRLFYNPSVSQVSINFVRTAVPI
jgi:hypothetical protein